MIIKTRQIKDAEARAGEIVTTYTMGGRGVGIGYLVNDEVFITTGSYWAVNGLLDVFPVERFDRDGGEGYLNKAKSL